MSESLLDTPEGFVWLFDRLTLGCMTPTEQAQWRVFHDEVWELLLIDPSVHEGCAPADDLKQAERDLAETIQEHAQELVEARGEGYRQACADILARIEPMEITEDEARSERSTDGFVAARTRMAAGIEKLRERGPAPEPEPTPLVAA